MITDQITRRGDLSVADHLKEIRCWAEREGVEMTGLRAVYIFEGRITFSAKFSTAADAARFRNAFGGEGAP